MRNGYRVLPQIRTKPAPDLEVPELFSRCATSPQPLVSCSYRPSPVGTIYRTRWLHYRNPVELLIDLEPDRWQALENDGEFTRAYHTVVQQFDSYMAPREPTWYEQAVGEEPPGMFAYFSTEYGWHECLQTYSGGLGVLSGDHCKSASDWASVHRRRIEYRHGYFRQTIDAEASSSPSIPTTTCSDCRCFPSSTLPAGASRQSRAAERSLYCAWGRRASRVRCSCRLGSADQSSCRMPHHLGAVRRRPGDALCQEIVWEWAGRGRWPHSASARRSGT